MYKVINQEKYPDGDVTYVKEKKHTLKSTVKEWVYMEAISIVQEEKCEIEIWNNQGKHLEEK